MTRGVGGEGGGAARGLAAQRCRRRGGIIWRRSPLGSALERSSRLLTPFKEFLLSFGGPAVTLVFLPLIFTTPSPAQSVLLGQARRREDGEAAGLKEGGGPPGKAPPARCALSREREEERKCARARKCASTGLGPGPRGRALGLGPARSGASPVLRGSAGTSSLAGAAPGSGRAAPFFIFLPVAPTWTKNPTFGLYRKRKPPASSV